MKTYSFLTTLSEMSELICDKIYEHIFQKSVLEISRSRERVEYDFKCEPATRSMVLGLIIL